VAELVKIKPCITKPLFGFSGGMRFHFSDGLGNELGVWSDGVVKKFRPVLRRRGLSRTAFSADWRNPHEHWPICTFEKILHRHFHTYVENIVRSAEPANRLICKQSIIYLKCSWCAVKNLSTSRKTLAVAARSHRPPGHC
jgi:hypothetical protein